MKKILKPSRYIIGSLLAIIALQTAGYIIAMEQEQQTLSPRKQNLVRQLAAHYKETWILYKKRKAGNASAQELTKLEERMKSIKKAAIKAGIFAAFIAALFVGKWGYGKYQKAQEAAQRTKKEEGIELKEAPKQNWERELQEAIQTKNYDGVEILLKSEKVTPNFMMLTTVFDPPFIPLHEAVNSKDRQMLRLLLKYGANPNIQDSWGNTPLSNSAKQNEKEIVQILLDSPEINVNLGGNYTPLTLTNDAEIVKLLLSKGADPNLGKYPDFQPLFQAVKANNPEKIGLLLTAKADYLVENMYGNTPAALAIFNGYLDAVIAFFKFFKQMGRKDVVDKSGNTLLHLAAFYNRNEIAKRLISLGADLFAKNNKGKAPIDVARDKAIKDLIQGEIGFRKALAEKALTEGFEERRRFVPEIVRKILKKAFPGERRADQQ
jgi:ankyrin repeat protein